MSSKFSLRITLPTALRETSAARFCEHLSVISDEVDDIELTRQIRITLVKYVLKHYFILMEMYEWNAIYEAGPEQPTDSDSEPDESDEERCVGCTCSSIETCHHEGSMTWGIWKNQLITHTDMHGFDTIMAVTQHNINTHFKSLHAQAQQRYVKLGSRHAWSTSEIETETCLADWSYVHEEYQESVFFHSTFDAPRIQLVCNEGSQRAIFILSLRDGFLRPLGKDKSLEPEYVCFTGSIMEDVHSYDFIIYSAEKQEFSGWRLAFEVDLKLIDATEESVSKVLLSRLGDQRNSFKQLVMDFSSMVFSCFP